MKKRTRDDDDVRTIRQSWLTAQAEVDMDAVEQRYRAVMAILMAKDSRRSRDESEDLRVAQEKLALLLCQRNDNVDPWTAVGDTTVRTKLSAEPSRDNLEAAQWMIAAGYEARLSRFVLCYPRAADCIQQDGVALEVSLGDFMHTTKIQEAHGAQCVAIDDAIPPSSFAVIHSALVDVASPYWNTHRYSVEPPSPYFSYCVSCRESCRLGALGDLISVVDQVSRSTVLKNVITADTDLTAEIWAHNRPHASGHQLHYDSDNEGCGGIRHPLCTAVFYVTEDVGGPTLVTNQTLESKEMARSGWFCHPWRNRVMLLDSRMLHCVIPGRRRQQGAESVDLRRVTIMIALWGSIRQRPPSIADDGQTTFTAAMPFPTGDLPMWARSLTQHRDSIGSTAENRNDASLRSGPAVVPVSPVWEVVTAKGKGKPTPWPDSKRVPDYDKVFQGF